MSTEEPWPRQNDVLFADTGSWFSACVGWTPDEWYGYAEGYRRAADVLVQHVVDEVHSQDFLIFPVVFLYRQSIEVHLKHLILIGNQLLGHPPIIPNHHKLVALWNQCRPVIEKVWPRGPKHDLDAVSDVLIQFEKRDPSSTVFRYPVNKDGCASFLVSERIDILNFGEVANRVISLLDACSSGFRESLQNMQN